MKRPTGDRIPSDWISDSVDQDAFDLDGSRAGQRDQIVVSAETIRAAEVERRIGGRSQLRTHKGRPLANESKNAGEILVVTKGVVVFHPEGHVVGVKSSVHHVEHVRVIAAQVAGQTDDSRPVLVAD